MEVKRICLNCGLEFIVNNKKDNISGRKKLFCNTCISNLSSYERLRIRMEKDPEYRETILENKRNDHKKHIIHNMWKRAKDRAKKYNYEFDIEEEDIKIPKVCPLLEIPIYCGDKDNYENSPSLDIIDNSKGYIKNNVWVISKKANSMKNSASFEELDKFCHNIIRYSLNTTKNESCEIKDKEPLC